MILVTKDMGDRYEPDLYCHSRDDIGDTMLSLLLLTGTAFPCAALLTNDEGAIASSDAQEVVLQSTDTGSRTHYRVSYEGDAESFGWLIVVPGVVGEGDVIEMAEKAEEDAKNGIVTPPKKSSWWPF